MVKFILPLAFFAATIGASASFGQGICDHVDLELIKDQQLDVAISADGYETAQLNYNPIKYQGCNVEPKENALAPETLDVADKFYFFKDRFVLAKDVADAMQAAFDAGQAVRLRFKNDSVLEFDGSAAN